MRFHFVMLLIVIFVSLGMHTMASAATSASGVPAAARTLALTPDSGDHGR